MPPSDGSPAPSGKRGRRIGTNGDRRRLRSRVSPSAPLLPWRPLGLRVRSVHNHPRLTAETKPVSWTDAPEERKRPIIDTARAESHAPLNAMKNRKRSRR